MLTAVSVIQSGYPAFDTTWDQTQTEHSGRVNFAPIFAPKITPESIWASRFHRMELHSVFQFSALIITFFWDKLWMSYRWVFNVFTNRQQCWYFHEDHESPLQVFQISFWAEKKFLFFPLKEDTSFSGRATKNYKVTSSGTKKGIKGVAALFLSK